MRAISITMVLLGHLSRTLPSVITKNKLFSFFLGSEGLLADGSLGVNIFFVISGYLITKLLIIERKKTGSVNLKDFYIRRILRIFPVFYLYIIVIIILKTFYIPKLFESYTLVGFAAIYLWNYAHLFHIHTTIRENGFRFFGHFWSLSLEEQFYLIWPLMFIRLTNGTLTKVVVAIIVITPVIRIATYFFMPGSRGQMSMMLQTGGSTIFIGCLGAILENTTFFKEKITGVIYNNKLIVVIAIFLLVISPLLFKFFGGVYSVPLGSTLNSLCIAVLLYWLVYVPSKVSDFLNKKIIIEIGILSYSLYIWQQLFLTVRLHLWINQFPQNIFLVFAVASISYYAIEKPILQLKKRFKRI
jgi:peptidoglycan/LPS O-acetylase OafA/YrhL